jgi:hypothetical protein
MVEHDPAHALLQEAPRQAKGRIVLDGDSLRDRVREGDDQRAQPAARVLPGEAHQVLRLLGRRVPGVVDLDGHTVVPRGVAGLFGEAPMVLVGLVEDEDPDLAIGGGGSHETEA